MATKTKKDFELVASIIRDIKDPNKRLTRTEAAVQEFVASNPRFDKEHFRQSCIPGFKEKNVSVLPPGVSYQHLVTVDTSEWFPNPQEQFNELWKVTYKGVTYDLTNDECRGENLYPENHVWKGQIESYYIDFRHVFEQFVGRKPKYSCGKIECYRPDCQFKQFLCDFLFNVEGCEHIKGCIVYQCCMTFTVEEKNRAVFEKDLAKLSNILRNIKYEFEKNKPVED
jgi:hypothetical protein